jgi:phytoene dehydrogenase-like protein
MMEAFLSFGGEARTQCPVKKIQIKDGKANGVVCEGGEVYEAHWIVSNADYKRTFFELVEEGAIAKQFLNSIAKILILSPNCASIWVWSRAKSI